MKEEYKKKIKASIFIISVSIPFAMLLGFFIPTAKAGPVIPINNLTDPYNDWRWEVNMDDQLIYELEMEVFDNETGELVSSFKSIHIFNITSFRNTTYDNTLVSEVNATEYYYDCVSDSLIQIGAPFPLAMFGYNNSRTPRERYYMPEGMIAPFIFPRNGTSQNAEVMMEVLNYTFYENYQMGHMNYFDVNRSNYFEEGRTWNVSLSGDNDAQAPYRTGDWYSGDFYIRIIYDPNDKLLYQDACVLVKEESENPGDHWYLYNASITKVNDYNVTDEIDWYFEEGMTFYIGESNVNESYDGGIPYHQDIKVDIAGFNYSNYEISTMWGEMNMNFQNILINVSIWNDTAGIYEQEMSNFPAGQANNFFPFHISVFEHSFPVFMPNTTEIEDLEFMIKYLTPFGVSDWNIDDDKIIECKFSVSQVAASWYMEIDKEKMGTIFGYREVEGKIDYLLYQRNMTQVDKGPVIDQRLYSQLEGNNKVWINFTNNGTKPIDFYWGIIPVNPLEPLDYLFYEEIPDLGLYIDVNVNNKTSVGKGLVNFTINYDSAAISNAGIPESKLRVYRFNGIKWEPLDTSNYTVYPSSDTIRVHTMGANFFTVGAPEEWNWSKQITVGSEMYYETTGTLSGKLSEEMGSVNLPFVDFYILNITNRGLSYKNRGDGIDCWMNQINGSLYYWDPAVNDLVKFEDSGEFILNEYNLSYTIDPQKPFYFNLTEHTLGFPIVIPLLFNKLHLASIGEALNDSFYSSPMIREMGFPSWDEIKVNHVTKTLTLNDTTSEYYISASYYDNGTLKKAVGSVEFNFTGEMVDFNITTIRKYDYNQTDEVEWGVKPGDSYYFGSNFPMGGPTIEVNVTIVEINKSAVFLGELVGFSDDGGPPMFQSWLTFSNVWAKIEVYNITEGKNGVRTGEWLDLAEIDEEANSTIIIAAANNYLPFPIGDYYRYFNLSGNFQPLLMPKGIDGYKLAEDYGDLVSLFALFMFEGDVVTNIAEKTHEKLRIEMIAPSEPSFYGYYEWYLDNKTGISNYFYMYGELEGETFIATTFRKNHTFVWHNPIAPPEEITLEFDNYLIPDINATVTFEYSGSFDFFEAVLYENPVNSSLSSKYGNPMFFTDLFVVNHSNNPFNMTFRMDLPLRYPVSKIESLAIYQYNPSNPEEAKWDYVKLSDIDFGKFIKDIANNNITLEVYNQNGTLLIMVAWLFMGPREGIPVSDGGGDDDEVVQIPGYDLYILLLIVSLISTIIILRRRKIIRF